MSLAARLGPAPLLHHPVVVRAHPEQPQFAVLRFGEGLAAEAGESGEAQGGLDVVDVHVGEPVGDRERPRTHLLVRDDLELDLVPVVADRGVEPGQRAVQILVHPPVADRPVVPLRTHHGRELSAHEGHFLERCADDARAAVEVLGREPVPPDMSGLHRVVVHRDDLREGLHAHHGSADLTYRQLSVPFLVPQSLSRACAESHLLLTCPPLTRQTVERDTSGTEQSGSVRPDRYMGGRSGTDSTSVIGRTGGASRAGGSNGP